MADNPETFRDVTLFYREGTSDKQYRITIQRSGGVYPSWRVICYYGRRGATQREEIKTPVMVSRSTAESMADSIERAKRAKGYHDDVPDRDLSAEDFQYREAETANSLVYSRDTHDAMETLTARGLRAGVHFGPANATERLRKMDLAISLGPNFLSESLIVTFGVSDPATRVRIVNRLCGRASRAFPKPGTLRVQQQPTTPSGRPKRAYRFED